MWNVPPSVFFWFSLHFSFPVFCCLSEISQIQHLICCVCAVKCWVSMLYKSIRPAFFFFLTFYTASQLFFGNRILISKLILLFVCNNCTHSSKATKTNYSCYWNHSTSLGSHPDSSGTAAAAARGNGLPEVCSYSCSHNSTFAQMCTWSPTRSSAVILSHQPVCVISVDYFCSQAFSEHFCKCTSEVVVMVCNRRVFLFNLDHTHRNQKHNSYLITNVLVFRLHFFWWRMLQRIFAKLQV